MKRTMFALSIVAVISSLTATADDQSHAFNDAVSNLHSLPIQEKDSPARTIHPTISAHPDITQAAAVTMPTARHSAGTLRLRP